MFASRSKEIIKSSLALGPGMTFEKFVESNKLPINKAKLGPFFNNLDPDLPVYLTSEMIGMFGYRGATKTQRQSLKDMVNNYFPNYKGEHYRELSNNEYVTERQSFVQEYSCTKNINEMYPPSTGRGLGKTTHVFVSPNMLKEMFMVCPTEKGREMRRYYLEMVNAIELYIKYQTQMTITSLTQKLDNLLIESKETNTQLTLSNQKLDASNQKLDDERLRAAEDRKVADARFEEARRVADANAAEARVLAAEQSNNINRLLGFAATTNVTLKVIAKNHVEVGRLKAGRHNRLVIVKDTRPGEDYPYYAIRCQSKLVNSTIKDLNTTYATTVATILDLHVPNGVAFYNTVKEDLAPHMSYGGGRWFGLTALDEPSFIRRITAIDARRTKTSL